MDTEVSRDLPALVALARTHERWRKQHPEMTLNPEKATNRLASDAAKQLALAILCHGPVPSHAVREKAEAIRRLALG
jgi:hypothetical protein